MTLRFLHTADWQIGAPFAYIPGDVGALLREERFAAVRRIAALASAQGAAMILVAGDIFDANLVRDQTIYRLLDALSGFAGPWVMLPGNHDAVVPESVWHRLERLDPPANLIVAREAVPLPLLGGQVHILPAPLTTRHSVDDLTGWMNDAVTPSGSLRIGLAHGAVTGRLPAAAEAENPVDPGRAEAAKLDYLALGDWHGTLRIDARTWYSGTPEPDRAKENDAGNVLLVDIDGPGEMPRVTSLLTGRYRWHRRDLDLSSSSEAVLRELLDGLCNGLGAADTAVLRLRLTGTTDLAARAELDAALERWAGRLRHLEVKDESRLHPSAPELAALNDGSLLGKAAGRLQERAGSEGERDVAMLALRLLWQEQAKAPGR